MSPDNRIKVAVLVDLPRTAEAGGHVKCWERLASAVAQDPTMPLDLTVYFSGAAPDEILAPHVRLRHLPPVFSTANLKFLPYVPDHTDLAPHHPQLATELPQYDLIHTTDAYFAFSRTATRIAKRYNIPLTTSPHTDTPAYTRIFTQKTLDELLGGGSWLHHLLTDTWNLPLRKEKEMADKLKRHMAACRAVLVFRTEDRLTAESVMEKARIHNVRLGVDMGLFQPAKRDRAGIERDYKIPEGRIILLFVGRVDIGKNIYTLADAVAHQISKGKLLHLVVAGKGPAMDDVAHILGDNVTLAGYVPPAELARLYASVDAFALSSEVEIRSMAVTEALASGCPVLASEKTGIAGLFNHTPAMKMVGSDIDNWSAAIGEFAASPALQTTMRTGAVDYCQKNLADWHAVMKEDVIPAWQNVVRAAQPKAA